MMKYLRLMTAESMEFVAWGGSLSHAEMLAAIKSQRAEVKVVSAGFIGLATSGDLLCDGHSESLNVAAVPVDSQLANNLFRREA